jgi:hypothetical protein
MKITFHLGAHRTDDDRLMRSLIRNNQKLAEQGIIIPGPSKFRDILRDVAQRLRGQTANPETVDLVLDSILDTTEADHIVLSDHSFLCATSAILAEGDYYAQAGRKCRWLRNIFPGHQVRFALGIRNPATQIPAVFQRVNGMHFDKFLHGVDPLGIRWSRALAGIAAENPDSPLIVWCNEDTPLIWPEVMREVADHSGDLRLKGGFDILGEIMEAEGMKRLRAYLATHPPQTETQRWRILAAFLDKYAKPDEIDEEIDAPGWSVELIDAMTAGYEADLAAVRAVAGVRFIAP